MATQLNVATVSAAIDHDGFVTVQLLKDQVLGIGAYGKVCKAKCDNLLCAAKIIHETLFDPNLARGKKKAGGNKDKDKDHRLPMRRFEQECEFLSTVRHPNIVQYLGTHQDPDTGLPVLLMELMDDSLTHLLESSPQSIPYHIQVNVCHDITLALSYLHNRKIVHRDLSSNNVLMMIGSIRAKVTDFGMARLGDLHSQASRITFTMCPGTDVYMPPEAVDESPVYLLYTEKIDCFSLGVLIVQILTREFPKPGDRLVTVNDPRYPRTLRMSVPEIERRQNHISQIDPNHPLLQISLDCLKDSDIKRPSAQQLCERIVGLKNGEEYAKSVKKEREKLEVSEIDFNSEQKVEESEDISPSERAVRRIVAAQQQEIQQLRRQAQEMLRQHGEEVRKVERERDQAIEEREKEIQILTEKLEEREEMIAYYEERFDSMKQPQNQPNYKGCGLQARPNSKNVAMGGANEKKVGVVVGGANEKSTSEVNIRGLKWRRWNKAPCKIHQWNDAVIDGHVIYFRMGVVIYSYDTRNDVRRRLPDCPYTNCSITVVDKLLTTIGGKGLNQLFSLTTTEEEEKGVGQGEGPGEMIWMEEFPPMPTKRNCTTALSTGRTTYKIHVDLRQCTYTSLYGGSFRKFLIGGMK